MALVDELERRRGTRRRERLPCKLLIDGRSRPGTLRNLAAGGLFVATQDELPPGANVIVSFRTSEGHHFVLEARVPRRSKVSHSLAGLSPHGCALHILDPPQAYLRWLQAAS